MAQTMSEGTEHRRRFGRFRPPEAGEGGTIGAPAAVLNAVNDALRPTGVELDATPIPRSAIFAALSPEVTR